MTGRELLVFRCTIPGNPGPAKVNHRMAPVMRGTKAKPRAQLTESTPYKRWLSAAKLILRAEAKGRCFDDVPLRATVSAFWPRRHRTGPAAGLALGDVDAVAKAALDALEKSGAIGDDAQIIEVVLRKHYDAANPRVEIEVVRA